MIVSEIADLSKISGRKAIGEGLVVDVLYVHVIVDLRIERSNVIEACKPN